MSSPINLNVDKLSLLFQSNRGINLVSERADEGHFLALETPKPISTDKHKPVL